MPLIPDLDPVGGRLVGVAPSPTIAGMPGEAIARAGQQAFRAAGETFQTLDAVDQRRQAITDDSAKNFARTRIQKALDEHQQFRIQNPDENTWEGDMTSRIQSAREDIMKQKMSPQAQQEMTQQVDGWQQNYLNDTKSAALTQGVKRARQHSTNAVTAYRQSGDFESARRVIDESEKAQVWSPEEAEADRLDLNDEEKTHKRQEAVKAEQAKIIEDPLAWSDSHDPKKVVDGLNPSESESLWNFAKARKADNTAEFVQSIQDGMAGDNPKITDPKQIDDLGSAYRVGPYVRDRLKEELTKKGDAQDKAYRQTDQYQNLVIGKVRDGLVTYKVTDDDFDSRYVDMANMINTLPTGATKDELQRRLDSVRKGQIDEAKTAMDFAQKNLDAAYKAGMFGSGIAPTSLLAIVDDGYFGDRDKMLNLGFTRDQAEAIATLDESKLKEALRQVTPKGSSDTEAISAKLAKQKDNDARLEAFRLLFRARGGPATASPFEISVAQALRAGTPMNKQFKWQSQAEIDKALQRYGEAGKALSEWARINPQLAQNQEAVNKELYRLSSKAVIDSVTRDVNGAPPQAPVLPPYRFEVPADDSEEDGNFGVLPPKPRR